MTKPAWMCVEPDCERVKENSEIGLCATHAHESRRAARSVVRDAAKKRKPVKRVSEKRKEQNSVYTIAASSWIVGKRCQVCGDPADQVHHAAGRDNELLNEKKYWVAICKSCHHELHNNPEYARANGLLINRSSLKRG